MNLKEKAVEKGFETEDVNDVLIIERLIRGDKSASGDLYQKYYKIVFKKLLMLFNNKEKAEDLASEVILKVIDNVDKYNIENGSGKVNGWIKTIAHNAFLDIKRAESKNRISTIIDNDESFFELKCENKNIEQTLIESEDLKVKNKNLQNAFAKLKDVEKQLVILRFVENLSYDEISEILNIDSGKLRLVWHRVKAKLEKRMK